MGDLLHGTGVVFVQKYQKGSACTEAREAGFIDRVRTAFPNMSIQTSTEYAGGTRDSAQRAASAFLSKRGDSLHGVFTPNESSTTGMLMALQGVSHGKRLTFVGFDHNDTLAAAIQCKQIHGLIAQDAFRMGELGVKAIVDHLLGRPVGKRVDTGAILVTSENLQTAAIQQFLSPHLPT